MKRPPAATDPAAEALRQRLTRRPWRLLECDPAPGAENMARDEALLEAAAREETPPVLRFYAWDPPAVSLGHFQGTEGIDLAYAAARGWDVVRRPTGGRAVLHQHELTYCLVLPPSVVGGAGVRTSYAVLSGALNAGLRSLLPDRSPVTAPACNARTARGPNCFAVAGECDTLVAEGKLVGSAQVRRGGALLQHGSILLDAEPAAWEALFGTTGRLVTLRRLLGSTPTRAEVTEAVLRGFTSLG
ncbi:MAG TPA: lipoate--protein ligase family protein, partial [Armatimonadota bacterium]|nr:lipoate--protein ligase family protein [Armatimonadota bacterium]